MSRVEFRHHVAVLIHDGHGRGWSTQAGADEKTQLLFDPQIIEIVQEYELRLKDINHQDTRTILQKEMAEKISLVYVIKGYQSGHTQENMEKLITMWVPKGAKFIVREYGGMEHIETQDRFNWITA